MIRWMDGWIHDMQVGVRAGDTGTETEKQTETWTENLINK